ncbi:sensor histidine kinase [Mesonia sp. K7]|uniref:sensor histidine kinase n=1 Tax=Mesonia sp. K7 TaxID=2218606 RepID=UPI000DA9DBBA|nr:sensor histidine kinase [Mesonia sp. K7]PZD77132.1 sensor histidine kinase [Mesonia sp. K7]
METEFLSEENGISLVVLGGISFMFLVGMLLLLFFYFSKKKIVQKELEKKNLELTHQKNLLEATLETQEKERQRIARDLHDDISSKLNMVSLHSDLLLTGNLAESEQKEALETILSLSGKALENSRHIAHDLFPPVLEKFGLDAAIEELCSEFSGHGTQISYHNQSLFDETQKSKNLHVFRILQELIHNSIKHGSASHIQLHIEDRKDKKYFHYQDNGKGFQIEDKQNHKGLGMKNIDSRIQFLQGSLFIHSELGKGTTVIFTF